MGKWFKWWFKGFKHLASQQRWHPSWFLDAYFGGWPHHDLLSWAKQNHGLEMICISLRLWYHQFRVSSCVHSNCKTNPSCRKPVSVLLHRPQCQVTMHPSKRPITLTEDGLFCWCFLEFSLHELWESPKTRVVQAHIFINQLWLINDIPIILMLKTL